MFRTDFFARRCIAASAAAAFGIVLVACGGASHEAPSAAVAAPAASPVSSTPAAAPAPDAPEWHYEGAEGPANWSKLSPKFAACGEGQYQSPIDIAKPTGDATGARRTNFPPAAIHFVHGEHVADGINNGHTIQINYHDADTLTLGGVTYRLDQFHFHSPSEHTVDGKSFPMEMHLVHKSADGKLAVVGVFITEGAHNKSFDPLWANLPAQKGVETHYQSIDVDTDSLLPTTRTSYRYDGSLTTPTCSEGVSWLVMRTPIELSSEQIAAFARIIKDNNRPVQKLNGRTILTDAVSLAAER